MTPLPAPRETWHLPTAVVGREVQVYDEVDSTNTLAARLAEDGVPEGTVVIADHQTAGRGRYGRVWQSRPGACLLLSLVLRPPPELRRAAVLTPLAAVAVGDAVYRLAGVQAKIKWPNDLLVRGKKVCGILIEQGRATVVGIGLNLNQEAGDFLAAGLPDAASLGAVAGGHIDPREAAEVVVRCLDAEYARLLDGERVAVEADWKWRTGLLGRRVTVERTDGTHLVGRVREMGFDGLELDTECAGRLLIAPETVAHVRAVSPDETL